MTRRRTRRPPTGLLMSYRCPPHLVKPLTEARFELRKETRTELITQALEIYLKKKGFWRPEPETPETVPAEEGAQA
jgi:hypothetical protein